MSTNSILMNFIFELNSNILILLYGLASRSLDKIIRKTKMIKID